MRAVMITIDLEVKVPDLATKGHSGVSFAVKILLRDSCNQGLGLFDPPEDAKKPDPTQWRGSPMTYKVI